MSIPEKLTQPLEKVREVNFNPERRHFAKVALVGPGRNRLVVTRSAKHSETPRPFPRHKDRSAVEL